LCRLLFFQTAVRKEVFHESSVAVHEETSRLSNLFVSYVSFFIFMNEIP